MAMDERVSVAFSRGDLDEVTGAAHREGLKLSEFIRKSALGRAARQGRPVYVRASGLAGYPRSATNTTSSRRAGRARILGSEDAALFTGETH